jgi:transcriptional regulator with XRE-family HTH domain
MTSRGSAGPEVGERIRERRLLRGWSIRYAASRAGISHATWSRIERGLQATGNRFMLADIAGALQCSPADLAGTDVPAQDRTVESARTAVTGLRRALIDIDLSEPPTGFAPPLDELRRAVALAESLHQACDYAGATALLSGLLRDLHTETAGPDQREALRLLCDAASIASSVLRSLGHPADAWLGAERCRDAAEASGDPVLRGVAAFTLARAATACGSHQRAQTIAERAIDELTRPIGRPGGFSRPGILSRPGSLEVLGTLHLVAAMAARSRDRLDDSRDWLAQAAGLAACTGETTTLGLFFGPTNVNLWQLSIEADAGDPGRAVEIARRTTPAVIPAGVRQVFYYTDTARALTSVGGHDRRAVRLLLSAERLAPQHVRTSAEVTGTVRQLLDRSRRQDGGTELRALAGRLRLREW